MTRCSCNTQPSHTLAGYILYLYYGACVRVLGGRLCLFWNRRQRNSLSTVSSGWLLSISGTEEGKPTLM